MQQFVICNKNVLNIVVYYDLIQNRVNYTKKKGVLKCPIKINSWSSQFVYTCSITKIVDKGGPRIDKISGQSPPIRTFQSRGGSFFLRFESDASANRPGFHIRFVGKNICDIFNQVIKFDTNFLFRLKIKSHCFG